MLDDRSPFKVHYEISDTIYPTNTKKPNRHGPAVCAADVILTVQIYEVFLKVASFLQKTFIKLYEFKKKCVFLQAYNRNIERNSFNYGKGLKQKSLCLDEV